MEKHRALIIIFFLSFLLACDPQVKLDPATLRIGLTAEPDTLNPILASDAYAERILGYVNDSLIDRNKDTLDFEPKLAERWEISKDGLEYTFHLRKNVKWHDGQPFTADDVIYSFNKIKDPTTEAPFLRVYYEDIKNVEKQDDYTVKFTYAKPYFLALSMCGGMPLVPKHVFDDGTDFNRHPARRQPIGTGPYKFGVWDTNKKITLIRNEDYWGPKPAIREIDNIIISDEKIAFQVLKKGDLDFFSLRPIQWVKQTGDEKFNALFNKYTYLLPSYNYIGYNMQKPFFKDARVRLAMTSLINRPKLLEKINYDLGIIIESPFFPDSDQYNKKLTLHPYDPAKAKQLLTEAGWADHDGDGILDKDGQKFEFTFLYPSSATFTERLASILKEDLSQLGINMKIVKMEWAAFINKIESKDFEATSLGWSSSFESDPYQLWHSSQAKMDRGSNFVSFENEEADRLIEKARVEFDKQKRNALYYRFQEIIYNEQPYTFLFNNYSLVVVSKRFTNVKVHKAGLDPLDWIPATATQSQ
ncbi:peptide-binding protein [bacterium]|nr:peptide-binding protein [bacterium]